MNRALVPLLGLLVLALPPALAQVEIGRQEVHFQRGKSSASLEGRIRGEHIVDYHLHAAAGQTLEVTLKADNPSAYFNVLPPDEETALFVGSTSGNHYSGILPKDGDYRIRVYLMRSAARRGESAGYSIDFRITGSAGTTTGGPAAARSPTPPATP